MKLTEIKSNEENPRFITDESLNKLVKSISEFPEMLELRPIVIDENNVTLGGNMRLKACKLAGLTDVPVKVAKGLTEEQKREFIIKDNLGFGQWDWEILSTDWKSEQLADWGLSSFNFDDNNFDEFFEEKDSEPQEKDDHSITLHFTTEQYESITEHFKSVGGTKEDAILNALGL